MLNIILILSLAYFWEVGESVLFTNNKLHTFHMNENRKNSHFLAHSINACSGQNQAKPKLEKKESTSGSPRGDRVLIT